MSATEATAPYYLVNVSIFVKPENVGEFLEASLVNARSTHHEPGCVRFDVAQHEEDKTRFLFIEVYKTKEDFTRHQQTPHYLKWRETVAPWMAKPREGVRFNCLEYTNKP
ncbi:antibiotic biosynthesis monooxygenase [Pelomyxa schiedti]|nr:antibiotic biosynthesis monooxygenase [Pelomyxa schiedti]